MLTRRVVARGEIESSIALLISGRSQVAAHVLAWAAVDLLRGVAKTLGKQTFLESLEDLVRPEMVKVWRQALRDHYTFAKHADRDPERVVEDYSVELTFMVILSAISDYGTMYNQLTLEMYLFRGWLLTRSPHLLVDGAFEEIVPNAARIFGDGALDTVRALHTELERDRARYVAMIPPDRIAAIEL